MREASPCSRWEQIQRPTTRQYAESEGTLSLKWDISIKSHTSQARELHRREGWKNVRARGHGGHQVNKAPIRQHGQAISTHRNISSTHRVCASLPQIGPGAETWTHVPIPYRIYIQLTTTCDGNLASPRGSHWRNKLLKNRSHAQY